MKEHKDDEEAGFEEIQQALKSDEVSKIYTNSFVTASSTCDVSVLLKQMDKSLVLLNMSFTAAKTLSIELGNLISAIETKTGNQIMTVYQIRDAMEDK